MLKDIIKEMKEKGIACIRCKKGRMFWSNTRQTYVCSLNADHTAMFF
jgi:hypothetical protein